MWDSLFDSFLCWKSFAKIDELNKKCLEWSVFLKIPKIFSQCSYEHFMFHKNNKNIFVINFLCEKNKNEICWVFDLLSANARNQNAIQLVVLLTFKLGPIFFNCTINGYFQKKETLRRKYLMSIKSYILNSKNRLRNYFETLCWKSHCCLRYFQQNLIWL